MGIAQEASIGTTSPFYREGVSPSETVVHEADSPFGPVYVVDVGDQRTLRFDSPEGTLQSSILKSAPLAVPTNYVRVPLADALGSCPAARGWTWWNSTP
jgi:hypothetical protein